MDRSADLLAELRDSRLPELSEASVLADAATAFVAGLILALAIALVVRVFARRPPSRRDRALAELAASRALAPDERLLAQARLLRRVADERDRRGVDSTSAHWADVFDQRLDTDFFTAGPGVVLREALYRPDARVDPEQIDRELVKLLRRIRR